MNESRLGGQEQGILMPLTPSQSPVPVGLVPATIPNWGTRLGSTPPAAGAGAGAGGAGAGGGGAGAAAGGGLPAISEASCALKVVAAAGQPTPGPCRFCRVEIEVCMRVMADCWELSVGKGAGTPALLTSWPAATFAESD